MDMKFFQDNWMLIAVALGSGTALMLPVLKGATASGISPAQAVQLINREKAVVVDVCEADEYAAGHIANSRNLPVSAFEAGLEAAVKNKTVPLILVCASGGRANRVAAVARKLGYEKAQVLAGGMRAWKEASLPVVKA